MKTSINQKTGLKEITIDGKICSVGKLIHTSNSQYYNCRVEIIYPKGNIEKIGSKLWKSLYDLFPDFFVPGAKVSLTVPIEGEYKESPIIKERVLSYSELLLIKNPSNISYNELLSTLEWKNRRNTIINRDAQQCNHCKQGASNIFDTDEKPFRYVSVREEEVSFDNDTEVIKFPFKIILEEPLYLHVHHKYYIYNKLPWEYDESALITLCNICHNKVHETEFIKLFYTDNLSSYEVLTPCHRCNGTGWFSEFKHIQNGICFECRGNRFTKSLIN